MANCTPSHNLVPTQGSPPYVQQLDELLYATLTLTLGGVIPACTIAITWSSRQVHTRINLQ
jgi:hypothetical protein